MQFSPGDFARETRVLPVEERPGHYRAQLSPAWNILYVFGGVSMAVAASAARTACTRDDFDLVSTTATFLAPVKAGALSLHARPLRQGKGSEVWAVELANTPGEPALHLVATLGPKAPTDTRFLDVRCPTVPSPAELATATARDGSRSALTPFFHSVEARPVPPAEAPDMEGRARWLGWQRLAVPPHGEDGLLDPLAYIPAADMIGPALRTARGPDASKIMVISLEINVQFYARTASSWLLQDTHVRHADHGYVSGSVHLWDEARTLVAYAEQRAVMRPRNW